MKFRHVIQDDTIDVTISGELEVRSCTCLENYWALQVGKHASIRLDLSGIDGTDEDGLATLAALIEASLDEGRTLTVEHAPEVVRTTLERAGLTKRDGLVARP